MDPRLQRRVQRYGWDKAADYYEGYWSSQLAPAQDLLLDMAALQPGERVLEVACGTGLVTFRAAASVGDDGHVVGTDISGEMVNRVTDEAQRRGVDNVTFDRMEAENLKVEDSGFNAVLCALGLMYVTDALHSVRELHRALMPGGRAVSSVWGARGNCGWAEIFPIVDARVKSEVCPMFFQLGTGNALQMAYEAAGFKSVVTEKISTTLEYTSEEDAIGAAFAGGPVALAYSRFDAATRDAAHTEYIASIAPYRHGSGYRIPGEFVIVRGFKT